jgi:hypothetical protein
MRVAPVRLLPALALLLAAASTPRVDGVRFTWKVTSSAADDASRAAAPPSMSVTVAGDKLRTEQLEARPGTSPGAYSLIDASTGTTTMVDPALKQALVIDTKGGAGLASAAGGLGTKFDISDISSSVADLGAGESLLGRSTHKYHISRSYVVTLSILGRKSTTRQQDEVDAWITNDFAGQRAFEELGRVLVRSTAMLGGNAGKKLREDADKMPQGVPLKQVVTTTSTSDKGEARTTTTTMEMTELTPGSFDASLFEVPAGYQVVDLNAQLAEASKAVQKAKADCEAKRGAGKCEGSGEINADSIFAAARSGALAGVKEGVNESAKDAAKKAIKGLFRKP